MVTAVAEPTFRRAVFLTSVTSLLVPLGGVITAPILAHALSVDGRGALVAALAPAALMLNAATLGLPDSLTYHLAKRPEVTRHVLGRSSVITTALGAVCVGIVLLALPYLRDGSHSLGTYIMLGSVLTVPALSINLLRGAAIGQQMWGRVSAERFVNVASRVIAFVALYVLHDLTVVNAVWVNVLTPLIAGLVYYPLVLRPASSAAEAILRQPTAVVTQRVGGGARHDQRSGRTNQRHGQSNQRNGRSNPPNGRPSDGGGRHKGSSATRTAAPVPLNMDSENAVEIIDARMSTIVRFGTRVWFGSVMEMLLSRSAPLVMAPLSSVGDLGLYTVATTISDLPLIVALGIAGAVFGVNSSTANPAQVVNTSRLSVLGSLVGCAFVAITLPVWIGPLFGDQFKGATVPTIMLMGSAVICIPGLMAAAALTAWGRPGTRSIGSSITLVVNVGALFALVPEFGVYGAAWTSMLSNLVLTTYMVLAAQRIIGVRATDFFMVRRSDVIRLYVEIRQIIGKFFPTGRPPGRHAGA